jgi:membrane associated rhomboid family serine protease
MVSAPVGFQCPECVREGNAELKQGRTLAGGVIHRDPVLITKILVAANVVLFVLQYLSNDRVTGDYQMVGLSVAVDGEWWRLLTSAFLHANLTHIALNMIALWMVGGAVESRLGRWRYLTVYLLSALGGSVASYLVDSPLQASVGASGAVFGLFGALFVLMIKLRFEVQSLLFIIALNVVIGFVPGLNINWRAHLGGLLVGTVLTAAMVYAPQRQRLAVSIGASIAVLALCVVGVQLRSHQINDCLTQTQPMVCIQDLQVVGQAAGTPDEPGGATAERPTALSTAFIHSVDVIPPA